MAPKINTNICLELALDKKGLAKKNNKIVIIGSAI
jgi:hypothetical protein